MGFIVLGCTLILLGVAEGLPRLKLALDTMGRGFFEGITQILSVAVIVLAILKVMDVGLCVNVVGRGT